MSRRLVHPTHLSFRQLNLLEKINAREEALVFSWKQVIRPEFLGGAVLGLALGFSFSVYYLSNQANGLAAAARISHPAYTLSAAAEPAATSNPPSLETDSRKADASAFRSAPGSTEAP